MKYRDVLSMSRHCPGCCDGAMDRLAKYMPAKRKTVSNTDEYKAQEPFEVTPVIETAAPKIEEPPTREDKTAKKALKTNVIGRHGFFYR